MKNILLSFLRFSCIFLGVAVLSAACAVTPPEGKSLQEKASLAQDKLSMAIENGDDVSSIIPKMRHVKTLADQGQIEQADQLLDTILLEFEKSQPTTAIPTLSQQFISPRSVEIIGYDKSAMEAFITRDGKYLFFNNEEGDAPKQQKNVYYALRIDDTHFQFMGEIKGINSNEVDAVPTMDRDGNFYFVSTAH